MAPGRSESSRTPDTSGTVLRSRRGLRVTLLVLVTVSLCLPVLAGCAGGPSQRGRRRGYPIRLFNITDTGGKVFLLGSMSSEVDKRGAGGVTTTEDDSFFEEGIEFLTSGYFYHPNLIDWDAAFRFSLDQERTAINGADFGTDGRILGYNLSATILREKPVSLRVFAADDSRILDRDFARRVELNTKNLGAEITTKGSIPLSLLVESSETDETGDVRTTKESTAHLRFVVTDRRDPDWFTEFTYDREDTDNISVFMPPGGGPPVVQDLPLQRTEWTLSNRWNFGAGPDKNTLSGRFRYLDRGGFFTDKILSAQQRLDLHHSDTFSTFYSALYNSDQTDVQMDRGLSGEVGFLKSIYESLDLAGRLILTARRLGSGSEDILGGYLDMRYRKKTPIGRLVSSLLLGKERQKDESTGGLQPVQNEAVVLSGLSYSQLSEPNVSPGTLLVTNLAETIIYVENLDYVVRTTGAFTEIARLAGGSIADGQSVLVDYVAEVAREATFTTDQVRWAARMNLDAVPISVYYNYGLRDQSLESGDNPGNLERVLTQLIGVELKHKGLTVAVEHETEDRQLSPPSSASRVQVQYQRRLRPDLNLTLGGRAERLDYAEAAKFGFEPGRDFLTTWGGNARLTAKLSRNLLARLQGDYLRTRGRDNNEVASIALGVEGTRRSLDFSVELRHDVYTQELDEGTANSLRFNVTRRF